MLQERMFMQETGEVIGSEQEATEKIFLTLEGNKR